MRYYGSDTQYYGSERIKYDRLHDSCTAKLYGLKICSNGELVRDFVPGIKDGEAGLYDRQNDKWYHSESGTGLIAGPALSEYPSLPNPVTSDYTLMSDVTIDGTLTVNSGSTIYLNGYKLTVKGLDGSGTITDTSLDTEHPGELHVTVASGTANNTAVTLTGNLKLIKEGSGTLTASKASQSYTGGTEVQAGTLTLGTATHPLGNGNATQTVGENATFDFNAKCSDSTCSYGFILNTNSVLRMGTVGSRWNRQVFAITLLGDATYDFGTARTLALFGGGNAGETVITLNGHTLNIEAPANGDINTCNVRTVGEGTISYRSGMAGGYYPEGSTNPTADFSSANVEVVGNAWMNLGSLAFIAKDFKYTSSTRKWTGQLGANPPRVTGRYVAGAYRPPFTMTSGSTLDLTEVSGRWDNKTNVQDLASSYADQTTKIGKVSFTGAITVDLSGRTDLRTIAKSETPYVVTWGSQPNATFTLDAATGKNFKIEPDGTGIKIIPCDGLTVFVR